MWTGDSLRFFRRLSCRTWVLFCVLGLLLLERLGYSQQPDPYHPPRLDVPVVTTPEPSVDRVLELAPVGPDDTLPEPGPRDGRVALPAVLDGDARRAAGGPR